MVSVMNLLSGNRDSDAFKRCGCTLPLPLPLPYLKSNYFPTLSIYLSILNLSLTDLIECMNE